MERRRGKHWIQLGYGIQMPTGLEGRAALVAECAAWAPLLPPSGAFTGLTAAQLHGLWTPPTPAGTPLFAAVGRVKDEVKPDRSELRVSQHPDPPPSVIVDGLRVVTVAETLLACARNLGLLDLVCLIDSALHLGLATPADLWPAPRRKGAPALRRALALADARSESPWESLLRLLHWCLDVAVTPQVELVDATGRFVARADLMLDGTETLHEYDGADHRDAAQHRKDLDRDRRIVTSGRARRGYTSDIVLYSPQVVMWDCEATLGRRLEPVGLDHWRRLVAESLRTASGRQQFLARLTPQLFSTGPPDAGRAAT